jgi:hypothetical protein
VTDPRFRPRQNCEPSNGFGTAGPLRWKNPAQLSLAARDQLGAAQMQHRVACRIRDRVKVQNSTVAVYAALAGIDATRLGRLLRGDIIMRLEDIINAERTIPLLPARVTGDRGEHGRTAGVNR